jgi:hypothetical protein
VVRIAAPEGVQFVTLDGAAAPQMTLRLVTRRGDRWTILPHAPGQSVDLSKADTAYVIVALTPPNFTGAQPADYRIRLDPA